MKITHLRIYKPDGEMLEFERGEETKEGAIDSIDIMVEPWGVFPRIRYEVQKGKTVAVEAAFVGFPYSYRSL